MLEFLTCSCSTQDVEARGHRKGAYGLYSRSEGSSVPKESMTHANNQTCLEYRHNDRSKGNGNAAAAAAAASGGGNGRKPRSAEVRANFLKLLLPYEMGSVRQPLQRRRMYTSVSCCATDYVCLPTVFNDTSVGVLFRHAHKNHSALTACVL